MRELRNVVQRAYVMASGAVVSDEWLPRDAASAAAVAEPQAASVVLPIGTSLAEAERLLIEATLRHFGDQRERSAAVLGVSLKTLANRLKDYQSDVASSSSSP